MNKINWNIDFNNIQKPFCYICKKDTKFFKVPDKEWLSVVPKNLQDKIICKKCYSNLKKRKYVKY